MPCRRFWGLHVVRLDGNKVLFERADSTPRLQEDRLCGEGKEPVC